MKQKRTILIPAMLDAAFPLLEHAFGNKKNNIVILDLGYEDNIKETGLKYIHNDMCYPLVLITGQMIVALQSGKYDLENTYLLIPQAGDACRGSNYIHMIRKALKSAGFQNVPIISLNVKGLEKNNNFSITLLMIRQAVAAVMLSDLLMILKNQIMPYEIVSGQTKEYCQKWTEILSKQIDAGKKLSSHQIKKTYIDIISDFKNIKTNKKDLIKIGVVGELYVKYCGIGNLNVEEFLHSQKCEFTINGFSWYISYYIDSHLSEGNIIISVGGKIILRYLCRLQKAMSEALRSYDFRCDDEFDKFKFNVRDKISYTCTVGDGWLIGAEICNYVLNGYKKILCIQPFGCMPNHVCGKGIYSSIQRKFSDVQIMSVDYDSSGSDINIKNRIKLLIDI